MDEILGALNILVRDRRLKRRMYSRCICASAKLKPLSIDVHNHIAGLSKELLACHLRLDALDGSKSNPAPMPYSASRHNREEILFLEPDTGTDTKCAS